MTKALQTGSGVPKGPVIPDLSGNCKSTFTLTFTLEILNMDVWHDCNEGWLDLGPCNQGLKLSYQLYPGQSFDIDVMIWPHAAKIWCGSEYGWVRTWLFLERRWLSFSIRHAFPIRVVDLRKFEVSVIPSHGIKNDKNTEVYLPLLKFGERRYFAPVLETVQETVERFIQDLLWCAVLEYIPASYLDGKFDVPHSVKDMRHRDAVLHHVQATLLNRELPDEDEDSLLEAEDPKMRKRDSRHDSKVMKEKDIKKKLIEVTKVKFEIKIPGDTILAGAGRIVPFECVGDRPLEMGEIIILISSNNLPATDDIPIAFVNIDTLSDAPLEDLKKLKVSQLYTRWKLGNETRDSKPQDIKMRKQIESTSVRINDHHSLPLDPDLATEVTSIFLDDPYEIQLRGIRQPNKNSTVPKLFGYEKTDRDFGTSAPPDPLHEESDILIAVTKIDARTLSKGLNAFIRGDYPLYPPVTSVESIEREVYCTNDINAIRAPVKPVLIIPSHLILKAQMTLEVSMGVVGCKPPRLNPCFSRLFSLVHESSDIMAMFHKVTDINEEITKAENFADLLTGFAVDTGDVVLFYLEGPRDGKILQIWEMTEEFYPKVKPAFSSSSRYSCRLYPELLSAAVPFIILKMFVPIGVVLACPPVYARPAVPLPARSAALKIGRLISSKLRLVPCGSAMPTAAELRSFRLELCAPPRPPHAPQPDDKLPVSCLPQNKVTRVLW